MVHLYDAQIVSYAQVNLGSMLEYVESYQGMDIAHFYDMFLVSPVSKEFERGNSRVIVGLSGVELAYEVIESAGCTFPRPRPDSYLTRYIGAYWIGWALAYYQWASALPFQTIDEYTPMEELKRMYATYHEMDITAFCECMDEHYFKRKKGTKLALRRKFCGFLQKQLVHATGIPAQFLDAYEKGIKDINQAPVSELLALSRVMLYPIESFLEYKPPKCDV